MSSDLVPEGTPRMLNAAKIQCFPPNRPRIVGGVRHQQPLGVACAGPAGLGGGESWCGAARCCDGGLRHGFVVLVVCAHTAPASRRVPDREELHCPLQVVPEEHLVRVRQALNLSAGELARWHQSFSQKGCYAIRRKFGLRGVVGVWA